MSDPLRALFVGGGTGGHVFPLVAVAQSLRARRPSAEITFVGSRRGMEAVIVPKLGERLELVQAHPIQGGGVLGALRGLGTAALSVPRALGLVRRLRPNVVVSIGGYAAGGMTVAARLAGVPVALLEPNSVMGLTNRWTAPFAARVYAAFPETAAQVGAAGRALGMPLREGFAPSPYSPIEGRAHVVVLGGSQGAQALNLAVPRALALVKAAIPSITVLHQAGKGKDDEVRRAYDELGLASVVEVRPFVDDMPSVLGGADVVVARAGAGSIAEACTVGRAAIYVPFPFAADDHQAKNSETLARAGAACSVPQRDASPERLAAELIALLTDPRARKKMADRALERGHARAAAAIADDLLELVASRGQRLLVEATR